MAQNGYNQYSPYYYGNGSYDHGNQQASAITNRIQSYNTSNHERNQPNCQGSYYPQSAYSQQATYPRAQGSSYDQGSNSYSYQPQTTSKTSDTSALRHLANAARLQHNTDSYNGAGSGQGTGAINQIIDHNRSITPVSAHHSTLPQVGNDQQNNVDNNRRPSGDRNAGYPAGSQSQSSHLSNGIRNGATTPDQQTQKFNQPGLQQNHHRHQSTDNRTGLPPYRSSSAQNAKRQSHDEQPTRSAQQAQTYRSPAPKTTSPIIQTNNDTSTVIIPKHSKQSSQSTFSSSHPPKSPPHPTTVNPSQVFNQEEFAMRRVRARQETSHPERQPTPVDGALSATKGSETDGARKEQIEADMKAMIRKMQEYKSKDPSLFSQIWEQVKTGQAPAKASPQMKPAQVDGVLSPLLQNAAQALHHSPPPAVSPKTHNQETSAPLAAAPPAKAERPYKRRKTANIVNFDLQPTTNTLTSAETQGNRPQQTTTSQHSALPAPERSTPSAPQPNGTAKGKGRRKQKKRGNATPTANMVAAPTNGTTVWPNAHKIALALRQYLINAPGNGDRDIAVEEIVAMLAGHPSFPDLCDILFRRGFIIDKQACAKHMLAAAPEIQHGNMNGNAAKPTDATRANPIGPGLTNGHSQSNQTIDARSGPPPPPYYSNYTQPSTQVFSPPPGYSLAPNPHFSDVGNGNAPVASMNGEVKKGRSKAKAMLGGTGKMVKSFGKPPTKADLAKKRSFADIVDLTVLSDDEAELDKARALAKLKAEELANAQELERQKAEDHDKAQAMIFNVEKEVPSSVLHENGSKLNLTDVVDQLQRRNALQRSSYNPLTIARDILLATGKHPSMAPLNEHLAGLRSHFRNVDLTSDLSTFKWDVVDPDGPEPNDANDEDDPMPPLTQTAVPLPSSAPGSEVLAGGYVPIATLKRGRKRKMIGEVNTTIPSRSFGPGPGPGPIGYVAASSTHPSTLGSRDERSDSIQAQSRVNDSASSMTSNVDSQVGTIANLAAGDPGGDWNISTPRTMVDTTPRRRGRPPGSVNRPRERDQNQATGIQSRTPTTGASHSTPRPSSLRNELIPAATSSSLAIIVPPPSVDRDKPRRGRPRKSSPKTPQQSTPKYPTYDCRWKECPAKLHNFDVLRRHALKHADKYKQGPYPCLWEDCSMNGIKAETSEEQNATIRDIVSWKQHMDAAHFAAIAKRLGDGPRATPSSDVSDHYLSDSQGRKVTPIANPQHGRPDLVSLSAGKQTAKAYHAAHDNDTEEDRANALYEAHLRKRRAVGPGVLKNGAVLVNDKKRQKLQVDEGDGTLKDAGSADEV